VLPLAVALLVAGGLLGPPAVAAPCLAVVALLFGWLLFLSWPALPAGARAVRVAVLAAVVAGAVLTVTG
jgi:hypothetical protein